METKIEAYKSIASEAIAGGIDSKDIENYFMYGDIPKTINDNYDQWKGILDTHGIGYVDILEDRNLGFFIANIDEIMGVRQAETPEPPRPERKRSGTETPEPPRPERKRSGTEAPEPPRPERKRSGAETPEPPQQEGETPAVDTSKLSKKAQKLIKKVDKLIEKIEGEKSVFVKHVLTFKIKRLIAKIQKEIDIIAIKENYELEREALKTQKENDEVDARDNVASLTANIRRLQREIDGNEEYDVESPYFMYPEEYVKRVGGPEALADQLEKSDKVESQQAATRIKSVAQKRKELEDLEQQLSEEQERLKYSAKDYKHDINASKREETTMVLKQRFNIFTGIKTFFTTLVEQVKSYREEKRQLKELDSQQKEDEKTIEEEYEKKMEEATEQYEKKMEELREEEQKAKEEKRLKRQQELDRKDFAADFREQLSQMGISREPEEPQTEKPVQEKPEQEETAQEEPEGEER